MNTVLQHENCLCYKSKKINIVPIEGKTGRECKNTNRDFFPPFSNFPVKYFNL